MKAMCIDENRNFVWKDVEDPVCHGEFNVKINVETVDGFSGHSDRKQLMRFISSLEPRPSKIIIGHGEERKCTDLASSIYQKYRIDTKAPMNLETIRLR